MNIEYLSTLEAGQFAELVQSESELSELLTLMLQQLEDETDYDTYLVSFDDDTTVRVSLEDSPYVIVMDEDTRSIELYTRSDPEADLELDQEYDFDSDAVEEVVDVIASRILTDEM